ncbi:hypothetical protein BUL40_01435 [Croceivirga radicis]|uniref:Glycosyl transferase family 1 n=1 Tax=Croceivirga radicis TaxID=1929488 RepID=A0A1V6LW36_9FLAO|nr:glycosyltransferase [Croceivirga radicis]OQD44247.1 hypothetical protein BUL40_01435 [Croceivirga radicis]
MRILQINKYYWPDIGGVETVVKQYAEAVKEDHKVSILCVYKDFKLKTAITEVNGVEVIRCSSFGTFFSMPVSISFYFYFFKLYRKYDILHFHEPFPLASILSIFIKRKNNIIITWHSDIVKQKFLKNLMEIFQRNLCKKASVITTTSPNLLSFSNVISRYGNKVEILPLGIEPVKTKNIHDKGYMLCLGRLSYYKGIEVLLKAFEKTKLDIKLLLVGEGERDIVENIKSVMNKTNKDIQFINRFVSNEEKQTYLRNCSFLVFPSIEPSEAFGIIQLEAMNYSKPVINTNLPTGVPYVSVHNLTGITVTPNNVNELANAIDLMSSNIEMRKKMGTNALTRVQNMFSNKILMKKLLDIYKQL